MYSGGQIATSGFLIDGADKFSPALFYALFSHHVSDHFAVPAEAVPGLILDPAYLTRSWHAQPPA